MIEIVDTMLIKRQNSLSYPNPIVLTPFFFDGGEGEAPGLPLPATTLWPPSLVME